MDFSLHFLCTNAVILPTDNHSPTHNQVEPLEGNYLEPVVKVMADGKLTGTFQNGTGVKENLKGRRKENGLLKEQEKDSVVERLFVSKGKSLDLEAITRDSSTASIQLPPSTESNGSPRKEKSNEQTPYEKVMDLLATNSQYQKEVTLGKRVGFYKLGKELGSGNFSKVKMGLHILTKDKDTSTTVLEKVAVKIMEKNKMDAKSDKLLRREIENMERVNHIHIIQLFEVMETLTKLYFVIEFAGGGELYQHVIDNGRMQESEAKLIFAQILSAVTHMHHKSIIHRDIKAENVFISSPGQVKIGDFGFSTFLKEPDLMLTTFCGSPPYAAPELFRDKSYRGEYVDLWALGVLLYFIVTGNVPFRGETVPDLKEQILDGYFSTPDFVSSSCSDLISGILKMEPMKRYSLSEIAEHSWLSGIEIPETANSRKDTGTVVLSLQENGASDLYKKVNQRIEAYGIGKELLLEHSEKGVKSPIIGTYRIVLFSQQQLEDKMHAVENPKLTPTTGLEKKNLKKSESYDSKNGRSRACSIL